MRVFLDTNVLVSAFATRGLCADVVRQILVEHDLVTSELVLKELRRALRNRIRLPEPLVDAIEAFLREQEIVRDARPPADMPLRDLADRRILASAIEAGADLLVTGDRELLEVADRVEIAIVSPREFWELLKRRRS